MMKDGKGILQVVLEDAGFKCTEYSFEYRLGATCLAFTTSSPDMGPIMAALILGVDGQPDDCVEQLADAVKSIKQDRLGHDYIWYFPGSEYAAEEA